MTGNSHINALAKLASAQEIEMLNAIPIEFLEHPSILILDGAATTMIAIEET